MEPNNTRLSQGVETEASLVRRGLFSYRVAYARSAESRSSGDNGQDYLTWRDDDHCLVFALCDGVGQSFFGDLAAREVGEALVDWLWQRALAEDDDQSLKLALVRHLNNVAPVVTESVNAVPLPNDLSPLVLEVLEQKRGTGSHTTLVSGRLDLEGDRLALVWLGDSVLRIWDSDGRECSTLLGDTFHTESRWSSTNGIIGELNVLLIPLHQVSRILSYSDGLSSAASRLSTYVANSVLDDIIVELGAEPTSDDISLFEVWLCPDREDQAVLLPAPWKVILAVRDDRLTVDWTPVPDAERYQVEVSDGEVQRWTVGHPPFSVALTSLADWNVSGASGRTIRVRGQYTGGSGAWSAPVELIESPPDVETAAGELSTIPYAAGARRPAGTPKWNRVVWVALPVALVGLLLCVLLAAWASRGWRNGRNWQWSPTATMVAPTAPPAPTRVPLATPIPVPTTTPVPPPTATPAPTTTPWLTWTPSPLPSPTPTSSPTATAEDTQTPTSTVSSTASVTATVTETPTTTPEPQQTLTTPPQETTPEDGDLAPQPTIGGFEGRRDSDGDSSRCEPGIRSAPVLEDAKWRL